MTDFYGILLLDKAEITLRVYQTDGKEWRLLHYFNKSLVMEVENTTLALTEAVIDLLSKPSTQKIADWKICSRELPHEIVHSVTEATGLEIEQLDQLREQELLCKGMFTELW